LPKHENMKMMLGTRGLHGPK